MTWMHQRGVVCSFAPDYTWWSWLGLVAGVLVVVGAIVLYLRPPQRISWGVLILVAAVLSLLFGGGGLVGAVLAIVGGILALTWHAPGQQAPPSET